MKQQLLLLQDVDSLGKKGELVTAKPGYIRNFLLPKGLAIVASSHTLRKQEKLRQERMQQAAHDRKEAEELAAQIGTIVLETIVKVDPEGHMYGSISATDIVRLLQERGIPVEKRYVQLTRPLKVTGEHKINLKLKEDVTVSCLLKLIPEGIESTGIEQVTAPIPVEESPAPEEESP